MESKKLKLLLVAGEASADLVGSLLLKELSKRFAVNAFGVGGDKLEAAGLETVVRAEQISIVGVSEVLRRLPEILKLFNSVVERCRTERPDIAVLIDLPDFNLRLAKRLKALGIKVVYYVSPQVWVWRKGRVKTIQKYVDKMLVVFPFEKVFYDRHGVDSTFVGHPLLDLVEKKTDGRSQAEITAAPRLALLPGSRRGELVHHASLYLELVNRLEKEFPNLEVKLPVAPTLTKEFVRGLYPHPRIEIVAGKSSTPETYPILRWADLAVVASGTATLETALVTTPFCLVYSVNRFNAALFHLLVRWKGPIGMPNLLLGETVVQEFALNRAKVDLVESEVKKLIGDNTYRDKLVRNLEQCRTVLGSSGATQRVADEIGKMVSVT